MSEESIDGCSISNSSSGSVFASLPEGCISHAISLTCPRDACRLSLVSPTFRSAADSDTVWERFLPPDCNQILSRSASADQISFSSFPSKRQLYFQLCQPLLIDNGKLSFWLEKRSGKKCFMVAARELSIVWGDTPHYWRWTTLSDSRFAEVAELMNACWLEIHGRIDCKVLSRKTTYSAYLVFKVAKRSHGLQSPYQETVVRLGNYEDKRFARLSSAEVPIIGRAPVRPSNMLQRLMTWRGAVMFPPAQEPSEVHGVPEMPQERSDGWTEIKLGEFFNDCGDEGEIDMSLLEIKGGNWKSGLIIQGIEVRPKD